MDVQDAEPRAFVRGASERVSRSKLKNGTSPPGGSAHNLSVEVARQRALQAAEYYHKNVIGAGDGKRGDPHSGVNGAVENDALRAGVTPASSDAYYKAKLRAGFIDLRNSYNEKNRPRMSTYSGGRTLGFEERRHLSRLNEGIQAKNSAEPREGSRPLADARRGLYRSNSSLELEYIDDHTGGSGTLRRDYGSASSLDVMSTSGESFFAMIQDYRNENLDQRAPAPPQIHEVLRGRVDFGGNVPLQRRPVTIQQAQELSKLSNGSVPQEDEAGGDGSGSPRLKQKSMKAKDRKPRVKSVVGEVSSGGIFKKLRGGSKADTGDTGNGAKSMDNPSETDPKIIEERQKRKAFIHYDCQSIGITILELQKRRNSLIKQRNTTTGASAASGVRSIQGIEDKSSGDDSDSGDGKSNDLVLSCPFFRNEVGGEEERTVCLNRSTAQKRVQQLLGNKHLDSHSLMRRPACNGVAILDNTLGPHGVTELPVVTNSGYVIEHVDHGAFYYKHFFQGFEHQNFFGIDEQLGPIAISLKREKLDDKDALGPKPENSSAAQYLYRIILRTSELCNLRGYVLEDVIPSSSRLSSTRGLPAKDVLDFVLPELNLATLKLATPGPKTSEQLAKLDEQGISKTYKIGIMYCKAGQATEEEMYNNEHSSPAFEDFLDCIGQRVHLKGFDKYRGGLDSKTDSTGTQSVYTTFHNYEIMFHVSTMLPYTPNNRQQLLRKRHIGNDIVTIVFQEPGALPFTPKTVRSHFQHVFIIVHAHNTNTDKVKYSIGVSRSRDVPPFGPPIPEGSMISKSPEFAEFLLTKAINAENAAHKSDKFTAMATRTRQEYLKDLATNFVTTTSLDSGSKLSKFSLGSGRKKDRPKNRSIPDIYSRGALVWHVLVEDFGTSESLECFLAIAVDTIVLMEESSREVLFTVACRNVIGWTSGDNSIRLFYDRGECIALRFTTIDVDEVVEVVARLSVLTQGCETQEMTLRRNGLGQLGFHVHYEGVISDVEPYGFAWQAGLRQGSRLVEICKVATATLTHDQMIDLLRTSVTVKVVVIPPLEDGKPRRGVEELISSQSSLISHPMLSSLDSTPTDDDAVTTASSSRSTVKSGTHYREGKPSTRTGNVYPHNLRSEHQSIHDRPVTQRNTGTSSYTDARPHTGGELRVVNINLEQRFLQSEAHHPRQASHDSAASRSSGHGSLDGHTSEGHTSRTDNISSEGFASGDDRHARHGSRETAEGVKSEWAGRVTIYPAYGRDSQPDSQPQQNPRHAVVSSASTNDRYYGDHNNTDHHHSNHVDHHGSSNYLSGYVSRSAFSTPHTSGDSSQSYNNLASEKSASKMSSNYYGGSQGHLPATSLTNLSDLSSSHSSGGGSLKHSKEREREREQRDRVRERSRSEDDPDKPPERPPLPQEIKDQAARNQKLTQSPSGRRRQAIVGLSGSRRAYLDVSPHSSTSSSPRTTRKNLSGVSSEESLTTRLRPGVSPSGGKVSAARSLPSSTFQEELMRLIDPDVSLAELESSLGRDGLGSRGRSPHRLHRTLSDESMCSTLPMGRRGLGMEAIGNDVIFTSTTPNYNIVPRHQVDKLAREKRLSPRATQDPPSTLGRMSGAAHAASSPMLPLPDTASSLDWSNLVDVAKAFEGTDVEGQLSSVASLTDYSKQGDKSMGMKGSKSTDMHTPKHSYTKNSSPNSNSTASPPRHGTATPTNQMAWRSANSGSSLNQRIEELEFRNSQLQEQLEKEHADRQTLEVEVAQLKQDNIRLQEESQTAAAQLRKFTEWFFNTIDRQ